MAVYLECERCGGGSFGDRYCESCERGFVAHPESRPAEDHSNPSNTETEPRQNRLLRLGRIGRNVVMVAAALTFVVGSAVSVVQWVSGWGDEESATPQPAPTVERVSCSDTLRSEMIEDMGFWEATKWAADHCE